MPSKIWINPKCPICGGDVYFPMFHTKYYGEMIKEHRSWYD